MFISPVAHASSNGTTNPTSPTDASSLGDSTNMFITLLTAELKAQDPTSPMDPTTMVQQVVSINQLEQLMQIRQLLQPPAATTGSTTNS
jgi:flagellar basal-body rod modification protein FlgD